MSWRQLLSLPGPDAADNCEVQTVDPNTIDYSEQECIKGDKNTLKTSQDLMLE